MTGLAVLAATVAVLGCVTRNWTFGIRGESHATVVGTVIAAASFLLVAVTALVALSAYLAASGRPDLHPAISFRFSPENEPTFCVTLVSR